MKTLFGSEIDWPYLNWFKQQKTFQSRCWAWHCSAPACCYYLEFRINQITNRKKIHNVLFKTISKQAGAEQCQAQHQLWKMLLEELDSDQLWCLSLNRYWAILWLNYSSLKVLRAKLETWKFGFWSKYMDQHWIKWYWSNVDQKYWLIFHRIFLTKLHR